MEIIIHGKNPNDEMLYFICDKCGCEFSERKRYCKHETICNPMDYSEWADVWEQKCPDCDNSVNGITYKKYSKKQKQKQ